MALSELVKEVVGFIEEEGYKIVRHIVEDYGLTRKVVIEKDGEKAIIPIVECYYDTDSKGKRTKWHGVSDIRNTPWYKNKKRKAG